jgi:hypothetical protein
LASSNQHPDDVGSMESQMDYSLLLEEIPKIIAIVAVGIGVLGALVQYIINSKAENRQREVALLERDIKISSLFSELMEAANGYSGYTEPSEKLIDMIEKNIPAELLRSALLSNPRSIGTIFSGALIPKSTALARQLAAAESIVNLAIRYPILLEPALIGLDVTCGFSPFARPAYDRLCRHFSVQRPLTNWGPDWKGLGQG